MYEWEEKVPILQFKPFITHLMGIIIAVIGGVIAHYVGYAGMFATQSAIALASFFYTLQMNKTVK